MSPVHPRRGCQPRSDGTIEAAAAPGTGLGTPEWICEVCRFQRDALDRRLTYVTAESPNDGPFLVRLVAAGGYCARHLRLIVVRGEIERYRAAFQLVIREALERLARDGRRPIACEPCPACATWSWAEEHALWTLSTGSASIVAGTSRLGPDAQVCLRHLGALLRAARPEADRWVRGHLSPAIEALGDPHPLMRLCAVAGMDPDGPIRHATLLAADVQSAPPPEHGGPWLQVGGAINQFRSDGCPVCSAARAPQVEVLASAPSDRGQVVAPRLCESHLWAVAADAFDGLARLLQPSVDRWLERLARPPATRAKEQHATGLRHADLREVPCAACEAIVAAVERSLKLLDGSLIEPDGVDVLAAGDDLCLPHVCRGRGRLTRGPGSAITRSTVRGQAIDRELEEAAFSGSTRWGAAPAFVADPWRRAVTYLGGDAVLAARWWVPDLDAVQPAV